MARSRKVFHLFEAMPQRAALETAARSVLEYWPGDFRQIQLLKYRENAVFSAIRDDGVRVALRLHRPDYHGDAAIRSELAWMSALASAGFLVPDAIPLPNGEPIICVAHPVLPKVRQADLLTWIDGKAIGTVGDPLSSPPEVDAHFRKLGALVAAFHSHAEEWKRPGGFERKPWNAAALVGAQPAWGRFWELPTLSAEERTLVKTARDKARRLLAALDTSPDWFGLIHADLIPDNILAQHDRLAAIDFDDCGDGWHLFDLATILFVHLNDPHYSLSRDALIDGYASVRPLRDDALSQLDLFLFLRSTTYLGWLQTRPDSMPADEVTAFLTQSCIALSEKIL